MKKKGIEKGFLIGLILAIIFLLVMILWFTDLKFSMLDIVDKIGMLLKGF